MSPCAARAAGAACVSFLRRKHSRLRTKWRKSIYGGDQHIAAHALSTFWTFGLATRVAKLSGMRIAKY